MYYIHHVHPPSASAQSVYLRRFFPSGPCLCVVQHTSLSFLSLQAAAQVPSTPRPVAPLGEIATLPINARILRVAPLPSQAAAGVSDDRLAVLTDHHQPRLIILRYNGAAGRIVTEASLSLDELGRPPAESGLTLEIEGGSHAAFAFTHTYAGILRIARLTGVKDSNSDADAPRGHRASVSSMVRGSSGHNVGQPSFGNWQAPADLARAFDVRLPHPHLISATFLQRRAATSPPAIALLSLSSTASRLPGLGMQCLPVLSFHTIDEDNQELQPLPWGPARRVPQEDADATPRASPRQDSQKVSSEDIPRVPGAFEQPGYAMGERTASRGATSSARQGAQQYGPAAFGRTRSKEDELADEEALAKTPLTRSHVSIPFADALGAHLLLSLPTRAGGGVLVFSEASILHVPAPGALGTRASMRSQKPPGDSGPKSPARSAGSSSTPGKRRKSSTSEVATAQGQSPTARRTSTSGTTSTMALQDSALSTSPTASFSKSLAQQQANENGKRRRSTASSSTAVGEGARRRSSAAAGGGSATPRMLRLEMPAPAIIATATVVSEPSVQGDDGVAVDMDDVSKAIVRILFCTHAGCLELLTVHLADKEARVSADNTANDNRVYTPVSLSSMALGDVSAPGGPGAVTYLGENLVHVASSGGDPMIIRIEATPNADAQLAEVHRWPNLAPVLDFVVDDGAGGDPASARSAQARIITCSGNGPTGSLRIVRNGVSLQDVLSLTEGHVRRIWSVNDAVTGATKLLILGYHSQTRIFAVGSAGFVEATDTYEAAGWKTSEPTLDATSIGPGVFAIVNAAGVQLFSMMQEDVHTISAWSPNALQEAAGAPITNAAINDAGQLLITFRSGLLALLQIGADSLTVVQTMIFQSEASAISINPLAAQAGPATIAAVALWKPACVKLLALPSLEDVTPTALSAPQPSLVRSIMLHTFAVNGAATSLPHLLIGLSDGTLISVVLSLPTSDSLSKVIGIFEKRSALLGAKPLRLCSFSTSEGIHAVFAANDRPTVIFSQGLGLNYSAVRHRDIADVCQFNYNGPDGTLERLIAFSRPDEILFSSMGQIHKLDISTVAMGHENPVSIAMCQKSRVVGVVSTRFLPEGRGSLPVPGGTVSLFDFQSFERLGEYQLELEERPNCIEHFERHSSQFLVVGTGYTLPDRSETTSGRLIVFQILPSSRKLVLVSSRNVEGNVYDVKVLSGDRLAAAINAKVLTYDIENDNDGGDSDDLEMASAKSATADDQKKVRENATMLQLLQVSDWACAFTATTLSLLPPHRLIVGDALRSVVVLAVEEVTGKLHELARDCDPYWTVACEAVDEENEVYIGSDIAFNLWTCRRLKWSHSARDRLEQSRQLDRDAGRGAGGLDLIDTTWSHIMQRDAAFHYGDLVNKMRRGALGPVTAGGSGDVQRTPISPRIVFGTAAGALGLVVKLDERASHVMSQLALRLSEPAGSTTSALSSTSVGGIASDDWRMLRTDHRTQPAAGFVDGDAVRRGYAALANDARLEVLRRGRLPMDADVDEVNGLVEALGRLS